MALSESLLDTIVALATPVGRSAVALIRLSGEGTRAILSVVVRGAPSPLEPRRASLVSFVDPEGETIDRGLLIFFPGPSSYTGEDVAELSIHGSPVAAGRAARERASRGGPSRTAGRVHGARLSLRQDRPRARRGGSRRHRGANRDGGPCVGPPPRGPSLRPAGGGPGGAAHRGRAAGGDDRFRRGRRRVRLPRNDRAAALGRGRPGEAWWRATRRGDCSPRAAGSSSSGLPTPESRLSSMPCSEAPGRS